MLKKVLVTSIGLAIVGAALYFTTQRSDAVSDRADQPVVATLRVQRGDLAEPVVATGTVKPQVGAEVKVGSQVSGVVKKLFVKVGDKVSKGALLAALDDTQAKLRVEQARAELDSAIAEEAFARQDIVKAEALERFEQRPAGVASLNLETSRRNLAVKTAVVAQARAGVADAQLQLSFTKIEAPISGLIQSITTHEGETVAASFSTPTFLTIMDLDRLEVQAFVDETDIGNVRAGQVVKLRLVSYPGKQLTGKVRTIYPSAQIVNNVVNFLVIVDIVDSQQLSIHPEMTAYVDFVLEKARNVLTVPRSAVLHRDGADYVVERTPTGWEEKPVRPGARTAQRVEILSGVPEGREIAADAQRWSNSSRKDSE
jgi:RND family efflux transporter MFP subunit